MNQLEHYLSNYFELNTSQCEAIASLFHQHHLAKGEFICKANKPCEQLSFIQKGFARIYVQTENKEVTQWISGEGYFVTELSSLMFNAPSRWNIEALTDMELITISKKDYLRIGDFIPEWHKIEKYFIAKCFTILEDRVFQFLSLSAEERYNQFFKHNKNMFRDVPHQYLASMLGMTPETLSRIRKKQLE